MINIQKITKQDIDERGKLLHEPRWLRDERMKSWEAFNTSDEINWKKRKTPKIDFDTAVKLDFPQDKITPLKYKNKVPEGTSGKITMHAGKVLRISLKKELANQGVVFCDMQTAVLERADLLEQYIKDSELGFSDKLTHFQKALWENGVFLWIPSGMVIQEPFQIQIIQNNTEQSVMGRNVFVTEKNASAIIEEIHESSKEGDAQILCSTITEVFAAEASQLKYFSNQHWSDNVYDLSISRYNAERNAKVIALLSLLGAESGRVVVTGNPFQVDSHVQHDAIIVGKNNQRFKIIAEMDHSQKHSEGLMRYKGILKDEAYSDLDGLIRVGPTGQFTNSRLEEHTLLLSDKARCDTLPALDIQTDNVQVSHAAAVTQADQEKMFYLMSRGLNEDEARALLAEGFFEDLLSLITRPEWYDSTKKLIEFQILTSTETTLHD
jgi:Fe-S cluster assembly scaffold protein SufB